MGCMRRWGMRDDSVSAWRSVGTPAWQCRQQGPGQAAPLPEAWPTPPRPNQGVPFVDPTDYDWLDPSPADIGTHPSGRAATSVTLA